MSSFVLSAIFVMLCVFFWVTSPSFSLGDSHLCPSRLSVCFSAFLFLLPFLFLPSFCVFIWFCLSSCPSSCLFICAPTYLAISPPAKAVCLFFCVCACLPLLSTLSVSFRTPGTLLSSGPNYNILFALIRLVFYFDQRV